jgi:hypothetical protein
MTSPSSTFRSQLFNRDDLLNGDFHCPSGNVSAGDAVTVLERDMRDAMEVPTKDLWKLCRVHDDVAAQVVGWNTLSSRCLAGDVAAAVVCLFGASKVLERHADNFEIVGCVISSLSQASATLVKRAVVGADARFSTAVELCVGHVSRAMGRFRITVRGCMYILDTSHYIHVLDTLHSCIGYMLVV